MLEPVFLSSQWQCFVQNIINLVCEVGNFWPFFVHQYPSYGGGTQKPSTRQAYPINHNLVPSNNSPCTPLPPPYGGSIAWWNTTKKIDSNSWPRSVVTLFNLSVFKVGMNILV